ncbi:maltokinase N-terminal cap-like domain-containing protein [Actinophytocola algeriensis]|uniref:Maltokinase n=1 Tax=Actinophytocola algeriensis TaxID=1768010 RepID=A0A7W7Q6Y0_9PSEU|nr:aminoglycoside phosphotransferase [Actinophytocola algeriensis]MBB4908094.1 maltokinase [Actinophytocola algeriensis]MBE1480124.1 maltokinase [Actinophytocola algeriensis]
MTVLRPTELAEDLGEELLRWLVGQRFFRTKGHAVTSARTLRSSILIEGDPALVHAMVSVDDGAPYQLLFGVRENVPDVLAHAVIGELDGRAVYDAPQDPELMGALLDLLLGQEDVAGLRFDADPSVAAGTRPRQIGVEQSNTSLIYGNAILKLYRQPEQGRNRDVDLHRALAGNPHIAAPLGVLTDHRPQEPVVLGFMQRFLPDAVEGWATATASVRDLLAEGDLHADEVGGDFAGESGRLGTAVAEVHNALAEATGVREVGQEELAAEADAMHARLDVVLSEVPSLASEEQTLRTAFDAVRTLTTPVRIHQIHGDLHLGQVLRTTAGWVLIDFEGEPGATPQQRAVPRSPLRDVAGMLRSFDYAAFHLLPGNDDPQDDRQRLTRATEWSDRNRTAFCEGYAEVGDDPREHAVLLRALELDKAVYEVRYEHHNRPDWAAIPLAAIQRRT